jgi:hypothetical protein
LEIDNVYNYHLDRCNADYKDEPIDRIDDIFDEYEADDQ